MNDISTPAGSCPAVSPVRKHALQRVRGAALGVRLTGACRLHGIDAEAISSGSER